MGQCRYESVRKGPRVSFTWIAGACILAVAGFVFGLTGFGISLVSVSLLPFFVPLATVVPLITLYGAAFAFVMTIQLRRDVMFPQLVSLLIGTILGTPVGVWVLEAFPPSLLKRLIGLTLMGIVVIEWYGAYPEKLSGRHWGLCAGGLAGLLGGAIGTPGPPVILYATAQGWSPRNTKAMLQAFFFVNYSVIVVNHWWAGLLTREVAWLACLYVVPSAIGVMAGIHLFDRMHQARFRRLMFALLFVLGLAMGVRG
jgi:uncharacterized protein